jgi:predicted HTH transcriptional regulator
MTTENGVWFSKKRLQEALANAPSERSLPQVMRTVHQRKIKDKIFVWAGIPKKRQIQSGKRSLKRMGFHYVRLIDGDFFVSL